MSDPVRAIFSDWSPPLGQTLTILVAAAIYLHGWLLIRRTRRAQFTDLRLFAFLSGLAILWLATASPPRWLCRRAPHRPHGRASSADVGHPHAAALRLAGCAVVTRPARAHHPPRPRSAPAPPRPAQLRALACLARYRLAGHECRLPRWHVPAAYDLALENETVHGVEHLCFLGTSLLFWWTIFRPWPARPHPADWGSLLYLALSDIVMTMLSGFLTFCDRPVYPYYVAHPNPFGLPVLEDQVLGAVIMWVLGSFAFLVPAMVITVRPAIALPRARRKIVMRY